MQGVLLQSMKDWLSVASNIASVLAAGVAVVVSWSVIRPVLDVPLVAMLGRGSFLSIGINVGATLVLAGLTFRYTRNAIRLRDSTIENMSKRVTELKENVAVLTARDKVGDDVLFLVIKHSTNLIDHDELLASLRRLKKTTTQESARERLEKITRHLHSYLAKDDGPNGR